MSDDPQPQAQVSLLTKRKWYEWAGWIAVATLGWHLIGYDLAQCILAVLDGKPLPSPQPISLSDVAVIIGLPAAGHLINRNQGTDQ